MSAGARTAGSLLRALLGGGSKVSKTAPKGRIGQLLSKAFGAPSKTQLLQTGAGALGGGILGELQNRMWEQSPNDPGWHPYTRGATIATSALLGTLFARSPAARKWLFTKYKKIGDRTKTLPGGEIVKTKRYAEAPAILRPTIGATSLLGVSSLLPRATEGSKRFSEWVGNFTGDPRVAREFQQIKKDPGAAIHEYVGPHVEKGVERGIEKLKPTAEAAGEKAIAELKPHAINALKNFGMAAGGGIAGYYGGGALGGLIGKLISPDKPKGKYEERVKRKERRDLAETIGKILGSYSMAIGTPMLIKRLSGNAR